MGRGEGVAAVSVTGANRDEHTPIHQRRARQAPPGATQLQAGRLLGSRDEGSRHAAQLPPTHQSREARPARTARREVLSSLVSSLTAPSPSAAPTAALSSSGSVAYPSWVCRRGVPSAAAGPVAKMRGRPRPSTSCSRRRPAVPAAVPSSSSWKLPTRWPLSSLAACRWGRGQPSRQRTTAFNINMQS